MELELTKWNWPHYLKDQEYFKWNFLSNHTLLAIGTSVCLQKENWTYPDFYIWLCLNQMVSVSSHMLHAAQVLKRLVDNAHNQSCNNPKGNN